MPSIEESGFTSSPPSLFFCFSFGRRRDPFLFILCQSNTLIMTTCVRMYIRTSKNMYNMQERVFSSLDRPSTILREIRKTKRSKTKMQGKKYRGRTNNANTQVQEQIANYFQRYRNCRREEKYEPPDNLPLLNRILVKLYVDRQTDRRLRSNCNCFQLADLSVSLASYLCNPTF